MIDFSVIKAIIFDMDGVLFLSSDCHSKAFEETLAASNITNFSYSAVAGMRTDDAFRQIFAHAERQLLDADLQTLVNAKRRRALELLEQEGIVAPNSDQLIANLRQKYRLALASSASSQTVGVFLRKSAYADAFEFCLDGSVVEHAKPNPDIYLLAVAKLGLRSQQCVVIEDSASGVRAAVQAGIPTVALGGDELTEDLSLAGAHRIVAGLKDIQHLFTTHVMTR